MIDVGDYLYVNEQYNGLAKGVEVQVLAIKDHKCEVISIDKPEIWVKDVPAELLSTSKPETDEF